MRGAGSVSPHGPSTGHAGLRVDRVPSRALDGENPRFHPESRLSVLCHITTMPDFWVHFINYDFTKGIRVSEQPRSYILNPELRKAGRLLIVLLIVFIPPSHINDMPFTRACAVPQVCTSPDHLERTTHSRSCDPHGSIGRWMFLSPFYLRKEVR